MPSTFGVLKAIHNRLPTHLRSFLLNRAGPVSRGLRSVVYKVEAGANHDEVYNADYYRMVDAAAKTMAPILVDSVMTAFKPQRVMDVGCGTGAVLAEFATRGVTVKGLEYSAAALKMCRERSVDAERFDLEKETPFSWPCDVAISTEVAEHLPEHLASRFVNILVSNGHRVVITAATPGQGGKGHINEQPHEYWIAKFESAGMKYRREDSLAWRREWEKRGAEFWYHRNVMVFSRD